MGELEGRLAGREPKDDEEGRRLAAQAEALRGSAEADLRELREALRPHGLTDAVAAMEAAPRGPGRVERYAHRLVLLLPDLSAAQRATFERVVAAVDGAKLAGHALRERTELALRQAGHKDVREVHVLFEGEPVRSI